MDDITFFFFHYFYLLNCMQDPAKTIDIISSFVMFHGLIINREKGLRMISADLRKK